MHSAAPPPTDLQSPPADGESRLGSVIGTLAVVLVLAIVSLFEGTVLRTYRDPIGIVTACTGHTGPELRMGQTFTREECREQLATDLIRHAEDLNCVQAAAPLTEYEKAALLSFVFNVGHGRAGVKDGLCELKRGGPSSIVKRARAGDMAGACASLSEWTGVGGRDCSRPEHQRLCGGIVKRRAAERALCEGRFA